MTTNTTWLESEQGYNLLFRSVTWERENLSLSHFWNYFLIYILQCNIRSFLLLETSSVLFLKPLSFFGKSLGLFFIPNFMEFFSLSKQFFLSYKLDCTLQSTLVYWLFIILDMDKLDFILVASVMFIRSQDMKSNWEAKEHTLENNFKNSENLENLGLLWLDCVRGDNDVWWKCRRGRKNIARRSSENYEGMNQLPNWSSVWILYYCKYCFSRKMQFCK